MAISPIRCNLSLCRQSEERVGCSSYVRITSFALGLILVLAGIVVLAGAFGNSFPKLGWTCVSFGLLGLVLGSLCYGSQGKRFDPDKSIQSRQNIRSFNPHFKKAESYFAEGNREEALREIEKMFNSNDPGEDIFAKSNVQETFIVTIAEAYLQEGNKEQAFKVIEKVCLDDNIKEAFLAKLAEAYLQEGNKEQALLVIKKICSDDSIKELFLAKLAETYLQEGDKMQAFKMVEKIRYKKELNETLFAKIAQAYYSDNDLAGVLTLLQKVVERSLLRKLLEVKKEKEFRKILNNIPMDKKNGFFATLAQDLYNEVKIHFEQGNSINAIRTIRDKASSDSYVEEFLILSSRYSGLSFK